MIVARLNKPVGPYALTAIIVNCLAPKRLELGLGVVVERLDDALGFRGELSFIVSVLDRLGIDVPESPVRLAPAVADVQQAALIHLTKPTAVPRFDTFDLLMHRLQLACASLSLLGNSVDVIAVLEYRGNECHIHLFHPVQPIWVGSGFFEFAPKIHRVATADPEFGLLVQIYHSAQKASSIDLRLFQYAQLLEVAADQHQMTKGKSAERISALIDSLDLGAEAHALVETFELPIRSGSSIVAVLVELRHCIAHNGSIANSSPQDFAKPVAAKRSTLPAFSDAVGNLVRAVLISLANRYSRP